MSAILFRTKYVSMLWPDHAIWMLILCEILRNIYVNSLENEIILLKTISGNHILEMQDMFTKP